MTRLLGAVMVTAVALTACATDRTERGSTTAIEVDRSGFAVRGPHVGAAAVIRSDRPVADITLRVTFRARERVLGSEEDVLPYCPARTDCPWGQLLFGERLDGDPRSIDQVDIDVVSVRRVRSARVPMLLRSAVTERGVVVRRNGTAGTVYLVVWKGERPLFARSFFVESGERGRLTFSTTLLPRKRDEGSTTAVLYPSEVPTRVTGPAD